MSTPPRVVIDSPRSVRSPPRSPRLSGLLFALRDVIGNDPDDAPEEDGDASFGDSENWSSSLPTLTNPIGFGHYSQPDDIESDGVRSSESTTIPFNEDSLVPSPSLDQNSSSLFAPPGDISNSVDHSGSPLTAFSGDLGEDDTLSLPLTSSQDIPSTPTIEATQSSPDAIQRLDISSTTTAQFNDLLSPVELSSLRLSIFSNRAANPSPATDGDSIDSGYADAWKGPASLLMSPPRSPSLSSTFDLLASPFRPPSSHILSPRLSAFIGRSPSSPFNTEFPDNREEGEPTDLSLDSPDDFLRPGPEENEVENSPQKIPFFEPEDSARIPITELCEDEEEGEVEVEDEEEEEAQLDSYGHTSVWDAEGGPTAVFVGSEDPIRNQVIDAIRRISSTPTHFLTTSREMPFSNEELEAESSHFSDDEDDVPKFSTFTQDNAFEEESLQSEDNPELDSTAHLAYLQSPPADDTLHSLYDVYSAFAPPRDIVADSIRNAGMSPPSSPRRSVEPLLRSNSSTPASSLRERVFTPPPHQYSRARSSAVADSPTSLSSPITSLDSGRASPLSARSDTRSSRCPDSPNEQEIEVSRKIPFGFRHSFSFGRSSKSSLISNRASRNASRAPVDPVEEEQKTAGNPPSNSSANRLKPLRLLSYVWKSKPRISFIYKCTINQCLATKPHGKVFSGLHVALAQSPFSSLQQAQVSYPLIFAMRPLIQEIELRHSPVAFNHSWPVSPPSDHTKTVHRSSSRLSEPSYPVDEDEEEDDTIPRSHDPYDETIRRSVLVPPHTAPASRTGPAARPSMFAIATPRPTLMFAIASDDVEQVRQVLESGDAGPNDSVGPQSALAFALTNDQLTHKIDIVKTLLAYGADPSVLKNPELQPRRRRSSELDEDAIARETQASKNLFDEMDHATRYYVERADAAHTRRTSALIFRSFFRPLTRVRYEIVGQDRALEQLFRVLSIHSRELSVTPIVVLLCGPSGHGKSLLARKFGSLLDVPTHTVNMTTLRSTRDLWQSFSMSPHETPTTCTLAEFLINNEGKRCVVVLDEIEKTDDEKALWSLLVPWEHGRCSFEANSRPIDVRNVIWLGTSNIGHDLVFQHRDACKHPEELMTREEYVDLMGLLRPRVSERLGASVLSRVTTVLPFVSFTTDEKKAISSEALYQLGGEAVLTLSPQVVESVVNTALANYSAEEGVGWTWAVPATDLRIRSCQSRCVIDSS
ncbi:uncharacterized protein LACBIDRAFT_295293 [Laccaria bicolor S238N-H82]|uniref:Predicted protein n=1 Tax=Laccaria bicolor (strain S238N-H82 / ATCC MYA-4686) TaxID=486041 RepID=B0DQ49_LACBS|nr:uncharacterized protein LACBIDRAFT_295293 [Laccaria bicolor S238N-H82]EDR03325.1 predicted protein [Laccaria bicolor S238N-H82]|eukprot:XP_001886121.1 predicted protein [Laccaria bicolor S238N-H82]